MKSFRQFLEEAVGNFSGVVYHGSGKRFEEFSQREARIPNDYFGGGVAYFTDSKPVAETYARSMAKKTGTPVVYTCRLTLKKCFDVDEVFSGPDLARLLPPDLEKFARSAGLLNLKSDKYAVLATVPQMKLTGEQVFKGLSSGMNQTAVARDYLISKGFDGLRYNGGVNMSASIKHNVYLAYHAGSIRIEEVEPLG